MEGLTGTGSNQPAGVIGSRWVLRSAFLLALGLTLGLWGGVGFDRAASRGCTPKGPAADSRLLAEAWNNIEKHYVDRAALNPTVLTYVAIGGTVNALGDDGQSTFLSPAMVKELKQAQQGHLEGIGVEIQMNAGHVVVVAPLDVSPAQRAGFRPGDSILKLNGQDIADE